MSDNQRLEEKIDQLNAQIERAAKLGIRGIQMGQRIEGDIKRIINSGWLNLYEYCEDIERSENSGD